MSLFLPCIEKNKSDDLETLPMVLVKKSFILKSKKTSKKILRGLLKILRNFHKIRGI